MKSHFFHLIWLILLVPACSSQSSLWSSKAFHNTTAHYNGYYYAKDEISKIENTILQSQKDDYNSILKLYPRIDSTLAKGYDKEIQETVKMASLAIQRHPNSKWVDDCYILVGKARLYSLDWGNAIQTFKFVNTKGKKANDRHEAIVQLARTFVEHHEFNNAEAAFDFLEKESLNKINLKEFYLAKAHYFQLRKNYDNMVRNLALAVPLLSRKDKPGRVYFIIGQVYQQLGFESEAFNFYKKCLSTNPDYEIDFYARLNMAQVAEISKSRDVSSARKSFKKLLKDSKNRNFRDKIYFEMGVFELKQKNLNEAILNYNLAIRVGSNKQIDGQAYLKLGEIYYDTLKDFKLSQAYYDSAVASLPLSYEGYNKIQARQKVLNEFVEHLNTIVWQDSLLRMAKMDTATLRTHIKSVLDKQTKTIEKKKRKKNDRIDISSVSSTISTEANLGASNWYFGSPSAIALGQSEFTRVWGAISLEDSWRRSTHTTSFSKNQVSKNLNQNVPSVESIVVKAKDRLNEEYDRIHKQLPVTEELVAEANKKIESAYFRLGDIYYFDLQERENAISAYETLLLRFPETAYRPDALYKLYLISKESDTLKANQLAAEIKSKFPESSFAKILVNPNYLEESGLVVEKQKVIYKEAYQKYELNELVLATQLINKALVLEKTAFNANLDLLRILILGKTDGITQYQSSLETFIKNYATSELAAYAQKLLQTSREFLLIQEKQKGIQYNRSFEEPHYFVLVFEPNDRTGVLTSKIMESFNTTYFNDLHLKVSNLILNNNYTLTLVSDLPRISSALEYYKTFTEKQSSFIELKDQKINNFVITKNNFDIFYRTKGLDEYLRFFEKNYHPENP